MVRRRRITHYRNGHLGCYPLPHDKPSIMTMPDWYWQWLKNNGHVWYEWNGPIPPEVGKILARNV